MKKNQANQNTYIQNGELDTSLPLSIRLKKMFSGMRWRIIFTSLFIFLIGLGIILYISVSTVSSNIIENQKRIYNKYASQIAESIANGLYQNNPNVEKQIIERGEEISSWENQASRILVANKYGVIYYDSYQVDNNNSLIYKNIGISDTIQKVFEGKNIETQLLNLKSEYNNQNKLVLYSYAPVVHSSGDVVGIVVISTWLSETDLLLDSIIEQITMYALIIILLGIAINTYIASTMINPLTRVIVGINAMADGNFNQRVPEEGVGEIALLASSFNKMTEQIENLDKTRNAFVSNASHELKTPLASMKILVETLLGTDMNDKEMLTEFLNDINDEIDRLNYLVSSLLALVKLDDDSISLEYEMVDIKELLLKTIRMIRPISNNQNKHLLRHFANYGIVTYCDAAKMQQVFSNIIENAVKYSEENTVVTIEAYVVLDKVVVEVYDRGYGIPEKDLPFVFDRFFRVDSARARLTGGTGLGLSISKRIVLLHNGTISVRPNVPNGSVFKIEIPLISNMKNSK